MRKSLMCLWMLLVSTSCFELHVEAFKLPDTGQDKCYDFLTEEEMSCVSVPYGQDAVFAQGPPPAFNDNGNGTVTDLNTGLIWQKTDDSIKRSWPNAKNYCEGLELGSYTDWRLPSRRELLLLVNFGRTEPAIDTAYFPDIHSDDYYWSSTSNPTPETYWSAYKIYLGWGGADSSIETKGYATELKYALCVRGLTLPKSVFVDNQDGTVHDITTGLMWQKGNSERMSGWESELDYCQDLQLAGYSDWRLPNIRELETLINDTRNPPLIDPIFGGLLGELTSSTSFFDYPHYVWVIDTESGSVHGRQKQNSRHVRCVRLGPESDYWDRLDSYSFGFNSVYFVNSTHGWCVGEQGTILSTQNGGDSWTPQSNGRAYSLAAVFFADTQNGWLLENITGYNGRGYIYHTNNGGISWNLQYQATTGYTYLNALYFFDQNKGWAVGSKGFILYTNDGGANWAPQTSNTAIQLNSIQFVDENTGWIVGEDGIILHTSDGGLTWSIQVSGTTEDLKSVKFVSSNNGHIVGWGGAMLRTINGGADWVQQLHPDVTFYSIDFLSETEGWAVGQKIGYTTMLRTVDGGDTWSPVYAGTSNSLKSINFVNGTDGWIVGGSVIMKLNLCQGSFDGDGDVDGSDIASLIANPSLINLVRFAQEMGRSDCPQ
jgi:photosystem II stability/assembly factor-like uncharacterized protein